jgi:TfoX/Sxy family transcriptional regulator of competence genes
MMSPMVYDEDLANRVRELLAEEVAVTERAMFVGLAFPVHGHMAVAVSGQGGLLVRVGADGAAAALDEGAARTLGRERPRLRGDAAAEGLTRLPPRPRRTCARRR